MNAPTVLRKEEHSKDKGRDGVPLPTLFPKQSLPCELVLESLQMWVETYTKSDVFCFSTKLLGVPKFTGLQSSRV